MAQDIRAVLAAFDKSLYLGRKAEVEDGISLGQARRMAVMLDGDPAAFAEGTALPPHWYSMFFVPMARRSEIGHDGHPAKGSFLPPVPLPRRMFVGRTVTFNVPLRVGEWARKVSTIHEITAKSGSSGQLVFVTVRHEIMVGPEARLVEDQKIVYREAVTPGGAGQKPADQAPAVSDWREEDVIDPVLLFRYSALTWNGHRIHYDQLYAREAEGYPERVVNGALTVHMLVDAVLRHQPGELRSLDVRLMKPLFVNQTVVFRGLRPIDGRIEAWAETAEGERLAAATLEIR